MTEHARQTSNTTPTISDESTFVVGGGRVGHEVADRLTKNGETVTFVDRVPPTDPPPGQSVHSIDSLTAQSLYDVDFDDATAALILEPDDAVNLLLAQLARTRFDVDRVLVLVNDPGRACAFDRLDVETIDATAAIASAVSDRW
jgi:Trk K+ transport system NAD-binding subunit